MLARGPGLLTEALVQRRAGHLGYTFVMGDGSHVPFAANVALTRSEPQLRAAVDAGVAKLNINAELRAGPTPSGDHTTEELG